MICGDGTPTNRLTERAGPFRLTYRRCPTCGRCDGWKLSGGDKTLKGEQARREYNDQRDAKRR